MDKPATLIVQEWELPQLTEKPTWMPQTRVLTGFDVYAPEGAELGPTEASCSSSWAKGGSEAATTASVFSRIS